MESTAKTYSTAMESASNYTEWLASFARPHMGRTVMEVGFGHGALRRRLEPIASYIGVDIDDDAVRRAKAENPDREFLVADIATPDFPALLKDRRFDTILCYNVLEHIRDDCRAIKNLVGTLKAEGRLVLFVPAMQRLYNDLDGLAGHFRRYDIPELSRLLQVYGTVHSIKYTNPLGGLGWWLNKFRHHQSLNSGAVNRQIALFERYGIPLSRSLSPFFSSFFGQSIICVVGK